jgi:hypothetical protein
VVSVALVAFLCPAAWGVDSAASAEPDGKSLIDAVANRNPKPEIVDVKGVRTPHLLMPLYSETYNWAEEERVHRAIQELAEADSEELWPKLMANLGDKRYCMMYTNYNTVSRDYEATVGDVCFWIGLKDLRHAYYPMAPRQRRRGPILPQLAQPFFSADELTEWWRSRRNKPLYEIQIDLADLAVSRVEQAEATVVSKEDAEKFIAGVKKVAAELRAAKKPVFFHAWPLRGDALLYSAGRAADNRKLYEAQKGKQK